MSQDRLEHVLQTLQTPHISETLRRFYFLSISQERLELAEDDARLACLLYVQASCLSSQVLVPSRTLYRPLMMEGRSIHGTLQQRYVGIDGDDNRRVPILRASRTWLC